MIAIVNVTRPPADKGPNKYELRVNHDVIATFQHRREEGLAKCLRLAAEAVEDANIK